jgi:plasmid stability protein
MDVNLSIKGVPEQLAERLRRRAERHHRSLQGELMAIIEAAAAEEAQPAASAAAAGAAGEALPVASMPAEGWKTVEQLLAERRARGWRAHPTLAGLPSAADIIRADRDSR